MTHREYLTRLAWLERDMSEPSRTDHYLMQIAQEIRRVLSKRPNAIKMEHFKIQFKREKPMTPEERMASSKRSWFGLLGMKKED